MRGKGGGSVADYTRRGVYGGIKRRGRGVGSGTYTGGIGAIEKGQKIRNAPTKSITPYRKKNRFG